MKDIKICWGGTHTIIRPHGVDGSVEQCITVHIVSQDQLKLLASMECNKRKISALLLPPPPHTHLLIR